MTRDIDILTSEATNLLKEMIAIPSPSFNEDKVCDHLCEWLVSKGIVHQRKGNNITARLSEQNGVKKEAFMHKPTLMLCAHIDTVEPSKEYSFDPYTPDYGTLPEGIVAGLGSNDDGASVVSMIATFRYFLKKDAPVDLLLVLTCEEERSGTNGMTGLWDDLKNEVDMAIIGEPTGMNAATSERGLLVIDGTAHGISGHAARNEGRNALYIALEDIDKLRNHIFEKISPRMGRVNLNVTQINAGTAHNVIPDRCSFVVDIRPNEMYDNVDILNQLQDICQSELKARNLANRSSATPEESRLLKAVEEAGIETFSSPTTSDWMRISCDAIKMGPGDSSRSHKKDEYVFISEVNNAISTYINFIERL